MIEYQIRGENMSTTDAINNYIKLRLEKLNNYIDQKNNPIAHINVRKYNEKTFKIEVTIPLPYLTLRAEETQSDFYNAVDLVSAKLLRQIRKFKTRVNRKSRERGFKGIDFNEAIDPVPSDTNEDKKIDVIRRKNLSLKPMDIEEAVLQMEMLDHDFFLFLNSDTNQLDIVYKRDDGKYGLIETENVESSK
ncbi:ribosome hibernation-promoting factor, HPF/YfiA family [Oenococcus oeni]|uniref:Ribosome hibernation promoting factor n=5 Tax=Oenococcus oeni TaxID=1247 RepID=Q04E96_OENOB|nr:ribosome-associated translation inhibitor RaiA [Oenococcus oeni]ABJ57226.1 SSU ribosomal protein S30P [Oenococcus oeni PSU-1]AWW99229.1 ribosome-associated translation inhibitor RaiA [Oenococcus oeni]EJN92190.1 sigma 54 modulation protein / SSU ribosomal protein S30P [Oenococcus oeni AWRIB304]EJO00707.1 sigma 54 modulation protein / SSU ribosomal protein S30P [Oenococcus oeni AWRIB419]EJO01531.1 sigma 54 modulation protein / SSU ribosomal protein S30P [Oenococcus oeni AWRIB318]